MSHQQLGNVALLCLAAAVSLAMFLAASGFQAAPPSTCSRPPTAWDAGPAGDCP